jgi:2-haloacid dehalogenase
MTSSDAIAETLNQIQTLTFDCYGTLVDWKTGLSRSFVELFGPEAAERSEELFTAYVEAEAAIESGAYCSYRQVFVGVTRSLARRIGRSVDRNRENLLADRLPQWPMFPDTNEALCRLKNRFRLGVLSNIDHDLFAATARQFDVAFDFVVTAEDVGSYKPAHGHFERLLVEHGTKQRTLHVAQSLYHDGMPASQLGLAFAWINRYGQRNHTEVVPLAEFPDLKSLADAADSAND